MAQTTTPDPRFGTVEAFWVPEEAAAMQLGWERILFQWNEIQPEGPEDWNTLHVDDRWLADAEANGREVVGLLKQTPAWATDGIANAGVPRGLYLPVGDPNNLWANYVRKVADYYAPRGVHHWIVWNEPDIDAETYGYEFEGSVADYYQLVKVASLVMKAADPQAQIHLAGTTYWHDEVAGREQYLDRFLDVVVNDPDSAENDQFFDAVSLHIYFKSETVPQIVAATQAILDQHGLDKPIWITETNAAPNQDPQWPIERPDFPVDLEQQAWFLPQAFALGFGAGVERIGVYKLTDVLEPPGAEPFGLLRADLSPRPVFDAYAQLIERLSGFTAVEMTETDAAYLATFTQPKQTTRVLWSRGAERVTVAVPAASDRATLYDVFGAATELEADDGVYKLTLADARCGDACIIGGAPVYLVEEGGRSAEITPQLTILAQRTPTEEAIRTAAIVSIAIIGSATMVILGWHFLRGSAKTRKM
jgi:hypothetical protein